MRPTRPLVPALLLPVLLAISAAPAFADITGFIGSTTTPATRTAKGFAVGAGLLIVGFEFEYADSKEDPPELAPRLRTFMGNVLLQTPFAIAGLQPYVTTGAGGYRENFGLRQETQVGLNTGGGVKISLLGPIRARLDYRVFNLKGEPLHTTVHRLYAGVNLKF